MHKYISSDGLQKLKKELEKLKEKRKEISKRISEAKAQGDLSENAEYSEAKESQSFNEGKIVKLEEALRNSIIIEKGKNKDEVAIGSTVDARSAGKTSSFTIVGPEEADPSENFISNESPLGQVFLGGKIGDVVTAETPGGKVKYKIIKIK